MIEISRKDLSWSYFGQLFQYGSGLMILPLVLTKLPSSDLAIWYVFIAITAFVNLLDFGIQSNSSRFVSYIFGGATELLKVGVSSNNNRKEISYTLLKSLIYTLQKIYVIISLGAFFVLAIGGSYYLLTIVDYKENGIEVLSAWSLFLISNVFSFYYGYYNSLLQGRGFITKMNKSIIFSKITYLIGAYVFLMLNMGLLGIALASLLSNVVNRILAYHYFYDSEMIKEFLIISDYSPENLFNIIWYNAKKIGIVTIGTFMLGQANIIISGIYLSLTEVAMLGLTLQIFMTIQNLSRVFFNTYIPKFCSLRVNSDYSQLTSDFKMSMIISWITYLIGMVLLVILGQYLLDFIGSKTQLPTNSMLLLFGIVFLMEITHGNCAIFLSTKNIVPYVKSTILTGLANVIFTIILLNCTKLGLYCFPISLIFVQIFYNAWKWPLEVLRDLKSLKINKSE